MEKFSHTRKIRYAKYIQAWEQFITCAKSAKVGCCIALAPFSCTDSKNTTLNRSGMHEDS